MTRQVTVPGGTADTTVRGTPVETGAPLPTEDLDAVPGSLVARWASAGGVQQRTLWTAHDAGRLVGAALEVQRPHTASAKLAGVWADPGARAGQVRDELLEAVVARAGERGIAVLKWESPDGGFGGADPAAHGFAVRPTPAWAAPVVHGPGDVPAGAERWLGGPPVPPVSYMRQTTDFTCGAVALMMGLEALDLAGDPDRAEELAIYRAATTFRGCDPLGLSLAAVRRGADVSVIMSTERAVLTEGADANQRELLDYVQADFRHRAAAAGVRIATAPYTGRDVAAALDRGSVVLVLIDQYPMHAEHAAHWILVHARTTTPTGEPAFVANDPWTDALDLGETWLDACDLVLPGSTLETLAWQGDPAYCGMVELARPLD